MVNNFHKIIILVFSFFLLGSSSVFALIININEDVSVSARVGEEIIITPGGGGIKGSIGIPKTAIRFSGEAYPHAPVTIWENGQERITISADAKGYFEVTLEEKYNNNALYTLFAKDKAGERSLLLNYPIVIYTGYITYISGIRFAPTISTDKLEVKQGDYLTVFGNALPDRNIQAVIEGKEGRIFTLTSSKDGSYKITIPLLDLPKGDYSVHVNYTGDTRISKLIKFTIGDVNVSTIDTTANVPGDCNADRVINLVDFSILAFWYGKANPPRCVDTNRDNKINLVDFSILAFYWTG